MVLSASRSKPCPDRSACSSARSSTRRRASSASEPIGLAASRAHQQQGRLEAYLKTRRSRALCASASFSMTLEHSAPVAQLDRASASGAVGQRFESSRACQFSKGFGASRLGVATKPVRSYEVCDARSSDGCLGSETHPSTRLPHPSSAREIARRFGQEAGRLTWHWPCCLRTHQMTSPKSPLCCSVAALGRPSRAPDHVRIAALRLGVGSRRRRRRSPSPSSALPAPSGRTARWCPSSASAPISLPNGRRCAPD